MTPDQWKASRPELIADNERVLDVWMFCGGWNPAAIEPAAAYYEITDMDFLIAQLLAMRDRINEWRQAQET